MYSTKEKMTHSSHFPNHISLFLNVLCILESVGAEMPVHNCATEDLCDPHGIHRIQGQTLVSSAHIVCPSFWL